MGRKRKRILRWVASASCQNAPSSHTRPTSGSSCADMLRAFRAVRAINLRAFNSSFMSGGGDGGGDADPLFQYIVLRRDLQEKLGWPLGSLVAQAAHASVAAIASHAMDAETVAYIAPDALRCMHKAVLEVKGEAQLASLAGRLEAAGIAHFVWIEQPENIATALATSPARKSALAPHFKKACQLSTWHIPKESDTKPEGVTEKKPEPT